MTDIESRVAKVLGKHLPVDDGVSSEFFGPRLAWVKCSCKGWKSETTRGYRDERAEHLRAHRAHVAKALAAAAEADLAALRAAVAGLADRVAEHDTWESESAEFRNADGGWEDTEDAIRALLDGDQPATCAHAEVRTFRSVPPHSKCLQCGQRVVRKWVKE